MYVNQIRWVSKEGLFIWKCLFSTPFGSFMIGCLITVVRFIETIAEMLSRVAEIERLPFLPRTDYDLLSFINYNNKKLSKGSISLLHPLFSLRSIPILNINHNTLQIKRSSDNQIAPSKHSSMYNQATQSQRCHFLFQWCLYASKATCHSFV